MEEGALFDCLWSRLMDLSFLYEYGPDGIDVAVRLSATCIVLRTQLIRLWLDLDRPFLAHMSIEHSCRALHYELEQRRLLHRTTECLRIIGTKHVCVAGGYAAWQLERHMDAVVGRDAFPRTVRGIQLWSSRRCINEIWTPGDVDIFLHSDDMDMTMDVVTACYREFTDVLFGRNCKMHTSCQLSYGDENDGASLPTEVHVEQLARRTDLPEHLVDRCVDHRRNATPRERSSIVRTAWNLMAHARDPLLPSRLNIVFTSAPPAWCDDYAAWVTSSFDLRHCCVAMSVGHEGDLFFHAHAHTVRMLSCRRVELTPSSFANVTTCANTMHRIQKYLSNGFSVMGDDANDVETVDAIISHDDHIRQIPFYDTV